MRGVEPPYERNVEATAPSTAKVATLASDPTLIVGKGFTALLSNRTASEDDGTPSAFQFVASDQFTVAAPPSQILVAASPAAHMPKVIATNAMPIVCLSFIWSFQFTESRKMVPLWTQFDDLCRTNQSIHLKILVWSFYTQISQLKPGSHRLCAVHRVKFGEYRFQM